MMKTWKWEEIKDIINNKSMSQMKSIKLVNKLKLIQEQSNQLSRQNF